MSVQATEVARRRTFAIISHPDAGKTTLTEKLLLCGGAIQIAGSVKARKSSRYATSDWMEIEKQRGISVTSSVMQFQYQGKVVNLLDTPGHADFSEDTYRTLTAVDSALMVIDAAKGVEDRTRKLIDVCRLRDTPVITFVNKLDRESRDPLALLDEIEQVMGMQCCAVTWPVGSGQRFRGVVELASKRIRLFESRAQGLQQATILPLHDPSIQTLLQAEYADVLEAMELVHASGHIYDPLAYQQGKQTPVLFGSAVNSFGVKELLDFFVTQAPAPRSRAAASRSVDPAENQFSGFVFKIQANMDPAHHDRVAFMRISSGQYQSGMRLFQPRSGKELQFGNALRFMAQERGQAETAWPGDIIGVHNHGTIQIGDTFTQGEQLKFTGIPYFAPELFRRAILRDPLRMKALQKGLQQLGEEGAMQVFKSISNNDLILGAVGVLQFDVAAWRLKHEYGVECSFEPVAVAAARWVTSANAKQLQQLHDKAAANLATDAAGNLTYLAPSRVNLDLTAERYPDIVFHTTREY